ncbi:MAG: response regulator receiver [Bacteroidetes bacterium]|nr:MAG: response regulator receiver [Bacteroidota bacterium]
MKKAKKLIRIVILEDSEFFNEMLMRQLKRFTHTLALHKDCEFDIESYVSYADCLRNLKENTDVVFVDYYLGNGITAIDVLRNIRRKCVNCKVIVISHARNIRTSAITLLEGASEFLFKDAQVFPRSCLILEDIVNNKLRGGDNLQDHALPSYN